MGAFLGPDAITPDGSTPQDQKPAKSPKPYRPVSSPNINPAPLSVLPNNVPGLQPPSLKKGGKVKKTGVYTLHKGERVLNTKQAKKVNRLRLTAEDAKKGYRRGDALKDL